MNNDKSRPSQLQLPALDPNCKKYRAAIDRVLITFDQIESWPDNIAFLNRLLKTVQSFPTIPLPRKRDISACLALCVLSQLPAGVQQKAFEVYSYIFSSLQDLSNDLEIFLMGLTPVLGYASTTVKNSYITLISTFLMPMKEKLRICSTSLILSFLPALEDEQDESFQSCLNLMDELRTSLGSEDHFWDSFWYASISVTGTQRGGTLAYLAYHLSRVDLEEQMPPNKELLHTCVGRSTAGFTNAFIAGLTDNNHLVQRGFLELLVTYGKISRAPIREMSKKEKGSLLYAAVQIVLKRDVGMNRRLWLWLTEVDSDDKTQSIFSEYAANELVEALIAAMEIEFVKANKIMLSLLDRDDIGGEIILAILPKLIELTILCRCQPQYPEILLSCRAILEAITFETMFNYMQASCQIRDFDTALFLLDNCGLSDTEQFTSGAPKLFLELLAPAPDITSALSYAVSLCQSFNGSALDQEIPPNVVSGIRFNVDKEADNYLALSECDAELGLQTLGYLWPQACFKLLLESGEDLDVLYRIVGRRLDLGDVRSDVIDVTMEFITDLMQRSVAQLLQFDHIRGVVPLLVCLANQCHGTTKVRHQDLCKQVAQQCWHYLGSSKLQYEIISVSLFSSLASVVAAADFEAFFAVLVARDLLSATPIEKFAALWTHYAKFSDRALLRTSSLLVLDSLAFGSRLQQSFILRWIHGSSSTMNYLFQFVLVPIYDSIPSQCQEHEELSVKCLSRRRSAGYDLGRATYFMSLLSRCLERIGGKSVNSLQDLFNSNDLISERVQLQFLSPQATVLDVFREAASCALQIDLEDDTGARTFYEHCIEIVLFVEKIDGMKTTNLEEFLIHKLVLAIVRKQYVLQQVFLEKMRAAHPGMVRLTESRHTLSSVLISGIAESRQHPVLQDFLSYCAVRIDLRDKGNLEVVLNLTYCVIEQVDLNLTDIDAVLNVKSAQETTTAHENVMLLLASLQDFGTALLQECKEDESSGFMGQPSNSFLHGVLFKSANIEVERGKQVSTGVNLPLSNIIVAACNVWLWGRRNANSSLPATTYISEVFLNRSYQLISSLSTFDGPFDTLQVLLSHWHNSTSENRSHIQALCQDLYGQDQIGRLCRIIKASLSFNHSRDKRYKEDQACKSMLYTSIIVQAASAIDIVAAASDLTAIMRHFLMHIPTSAVFDSTLLDLATIITARTLQTTAEHLRKLKRELCDILVRLYAVVTAEYSILESDCPLTLVLTQQISRLPDAIQDDERTILILSHIFANFIQPGLRAKGHSPQPLMLFQELVNLPRFRKVWKREVHDLFLDPLFFNISSSQGLLWIPLIRNWIGGEKDGVAEILAKPNNNAPSHLFTSSDSDRTQKTLFLNRITFLNLSLAQNAMVDKLPLLVHRIQDTACETKPPHVAGLILLQTILLKISPIHVRSHLVHLVLLLQKSFIYLIEDTETSILDSDLLYTTLRTLDLMLYLGNEDFQLHIWTFIDHVVEDDQLVDYAAGNSLVASLCRKMNDDYLGARFSSLLRASDALEMHVGDYLHNVALLYRDWNLVNSRKPRDISRVEIEIAAQLFRG